MIAYQSGESTGSLSFVTYIICQYISHIYPLNSAGQKLKNLIYFCSGNTNFTLDIKPQQQNPWFIDYRSLPRDSHMDSPCVLFMKAQRPPGCISPLRREEMRGLAQVDLDGAAEQELQLLGVFRCTGHCHGLMGCWRYRRMAGRYVRSKLGLQRREELANYMDVYDVI